MGIVQHLAVLALRQIVGTLVGETAADEVFKRCKSLFEDQHQRLTQALQKANQEAWRTLKIALDGESIWTKLKDLFNNQEIKAFRDEIGALVALNFTTEQREQCLQELEAAEGAGILRTGLVERIPISHRVAAFARLQNEIARIEAEWGAVEQIADELGARGYPELARFLSLRPTHAQGASLLGIAVRYFFNRAVDGDPQLRDKLRWMIQDTIRDDQRHAIEILITLSRNLPSQLDAIQNVINSSASVAIDTRQAIERLREELQIIADRLQASGIGSAKPVPVAYGAGQPPHPPSQPVALAQVPEGRELQHFEGHSGAVHAVAFSDRPTEFVLSAGDKTVRRWSIATGKVVREVEELFGFDHTIFSPDGRHAHIVGKDKQGFLRGDMPRPNSHDQMGRRILESNSEHVSLRRVDMLYGFLVSTKPFYDAPIMSPISVSPDGGFLLWGDDLSEIHCLKSDGTSVGNYFTPSTLAPSISFRIVGLALAREARYGLCCFEQQCPGEAPFGPFDVLVWDIQKGTSVSPLVLRGHTGLVHAVAVSSIANLAVSGDADGKIRVWDLDDAGDERACLSSHEGKVLSVSFSLNARMLISGGTDGVVRAWDVENREEVCRCIGHEGNVCAAALSPCGRFALSGGADKTVRLWELNLPETLLEPPMKIRLGKRDPV